MVEQSFIVRHCQFGLQEDSASLRSEHSLDIVQLPSLATCASIEKLNYQTTSKLPHNGRILPDDLGGDQESSHQETLRGKAY